MSKNFPTSDKLATLPELRYLLLEVLDRKDAISWYDLSFSCKELSFNFAFSFESTVSFLELIAIIKVNEDRSVIRLGDNYSKLTSDELLGAFVMNKTLAYLKSNNLLEQVFNSKTLFKDAANDTYAIDISKMPVSTLFIRLLLLSLGIGVVDKNQHNRLFISQAYKNYFSGEFWSTVFDPNEAAVASGGNTALPHAKPGLFISYAHEDEKFKNELQKHFSGLVNQGVIESWDGRAILPGEDWNDAVKKKLGEAQIVLFLVSADFMASEYIKDVEIKKTMERHNSGLVKIIPVIVRPCDFKALPIGKYQALPKGAVPIIDWPSQDAAYMDIVNQVRKMLSLEHKSD